MLQYPVSTMMYSSVSQHEICRLWRQARESSRPSRGRCTWCQERRSCQSPRRSDERIPIETFQMRTLNPATHDEPIRVERLLHDIPSCSYHPDPVDTITFETETKRSQQPKKVTYQVKAEINTTQL